MDRPVDEVTKLGVVWFQPERTVTVRMPRALWSALNTDAKARAESLNRHCVLKLFQPAPDVAPAEGDTAALACYSALPGDSPLLGPGARKADHVDDLIRVLMTIRKRFGNAKVSYRINWGEGALHAQDGLRERLEKIRELAEL